MTALLDGPRHPAQREDLEGWMADFGVSFTFDPNVDPKTIDYDRSLQNQARINSPLRDDTVDIYSEAMERGDIFPAAILYWNQGKLLAVDGNHRLKAKFLTGKPVEAYILSKDTKPQTTMLMTFEANAKHGLPNSIEERTEHAMVLIAAGAKKEDAAIRLNLTRSQVARRWDNLRATQMADQAGITPSDWNKMSGSNQNRLASIRELSVFKKAAQLIIKARLTTLETNTMVVEVNKVRSVQEQLDYLDQLEAVYSDRIQGSGAGVLSNPRAGGPGFQSPRSKIALAVNHAKRLVDQFTGDENVLVLMGAMHQAEIPEYIKNLRIQSAGLNQLAKDMEKAAANGATTTAK